VLLCNSPFDYLDQDTDPSKSPGRLILSGAIAGGLGGVAGNPADILLVRMTTDALRPPSVQHRYRNAIDGLVRLIKEEGPRALGRGIGANTASNRVTAFQSDC
jgi:dicarboxylate transporter 10